MLRRLVGQSALYTLGNIITRGASYALIPIYAQALTPTEYGLLGIVAAVMNAASLILMFGLYAAAARLYFTYSDEAERRQLFGVLWCFLVLVPAGALLGFDWIGPAIFGGWLLQVPYDPYIRLAVWSAYLSNFSLLPTTLLRNQEKPGRLLALTASGAFLNVGLVLALVVRFGQGVEGIVVAGLIANLIMAAVYSWMMIREVEFHWAPDKLWSALTYSLPFWPHAMAGWVLNLSDRVLLGRFLPLTQVGIYSLGYQIGQALTVVIEGGNQAWAPFFFRSETEQKHSPTMLRFATYFVTGMSGLCLAVALGARSALRLLTPSAYWAAEPVAVLLAMGFLTVAPYYVWSSAIMQSKHVAAFPMLTLVAGLLNVGLNLWWIPRIGILAAALTTVISYAVLAGLNFVLARRVYPLSHEYGRWLWSIAFAVLAAVLGQWVRVESVWLEGVARLAVLIAWVVMLVVFLNKSERRALLRRGAS